MKRPSGIRLIDYILDSGPVYVARNGVVCMVDSHYPEGDERRYIASATCTPYGQTPEIAQASAEDVAFMLDGYCRALFLFDRIIKDRLTPRLRRKIETMLAADVTHMFRNSGK